METKQNDMQKQRLEQQIRFIIEVDKVKNIFRQTYLADGQRKENDAEHSWHLALSAVLLKEHMKEDVDLTKVMIMVLIHDLVEIDAGDTYAYDAAGAATKAGAGNEGCRSYLRDPSGGSGAHISESSGMNLKSMRVQTPKFAHLLDNFQPLLLNDASDGRSWTEHGVHKSQVCKRNEKIPETSEIVWEKMLEIMDKHIEEGTSQSRLKSDGLIVTKM